MQRLKIAILVLLFIQFIACLKTEDEEAIVDLPSWAVFDYSMDGLAVDDNFAFCDETSVVLNIPVLDEASGIAASASFPGSFWSHNDSGGLNHLYLINENGECAGVYQVNGAGSRDWEDICRGAGPEEGVQYLYIADIGDNHAQYPYIVIYRVKEPQIPADDVNVTVQIPDSDVERFEFVYPEGPRDAECLMIDPADKELYLVTKRDFRSWLFRVPLEEGTQGRHSLELLAQMPLNWVLAGDISPDGKRIVLKDFAHLYAWSRTDGESILDAFSRQPQLLPYQIEPQGEAFAWFLNGDGYVTLSEQSGIHAPGLNKYKSN